LKKNKTSKHWLNLKKKEFYFKKAKTLGYRSRSAFKLIEINNKFKFLKKNTTLLDLGSSPGGWSQVASKYLTNGKILAVDLKYMEKIKLVKFIEGDFRDNEIKEKIQIFFDSKIDVVLSDIAANTSGNKNLDSYTTGQLCINAMKMAKNILSNDGVFLSKIFMGSVFEEIKENANKNFKKVVNYKPLSSKKESKEVYIFCKGILKI
jgi:23S rRNA (uridine2552-2'-O)-methyltransferase